jgi:hypothetical protein
MTPCLKDARTGEYVQTEVIRIKRNSFLEKYNKNNGWYVNWAVLVDDSEVYALVLKGTLDIQGLVAITPNYEYKSVFIDWMCVAPENNKLINKDKDYIGIGGHLFAIAAQKSVEYGFEGHMYGCAVNRKVLQHYVNELNAEMLTAYSHPYHFAISERNAKLIIEAYDYEWIDIEI